MPEGDTVHKLADLLRTELGDGMLTRLTLRDQPGAAWTARRVHDVYARGKHLFIEFDDGTRLRSHLGLHGSWHRYGTHESWQRPRWQASAVLELEGETLVCFNAKEVELMGAKSPRVRQLTARLGPDLAEDDVAFDHVVARARALLSHDTIAADLLLDQRVACGIGNVYKSEVLFLEGVHPRRPLHGIDDETLSRLYRRASDLLRRNLGPGPRTTRRQPDGKGTLWVYGRRGRLCLQCGARIESGRLGRTWRSTYWCSVCQG